MFNPMTEPQAMANHRRELLRKAKLNHLAREAQRNQARVHERFLGMVGDLMISSGARLKQRYDANRSLSAPVYYQIKPQNY